MIDAVETKCFDIDKDYDNLKTTLAKLLNEPQSKGGKRRTSEN